MKYRPKIPSSCLCLDLEFQLSSFFLTTLVIFVLKKYFFENIWRRIVHPNKTYNSFQIFSKNMLNLKVIFKSNLDPNNNVTEIARHERGWPLCCWWLIWSIENDVEKKLKDDSNAGKWVLIREHSVRAFQWIPTRHVFKGFQKFQHSCIFDESSLSIERFNPSNAQATFVKSTRTQIILKTI